MQSKTDSFVRRSKVTLFSIPRVKNTGFSGKYAIFRVCFILHLTIFCRRRRPKGRSMRKVALRILVCQKLQTLLRAQLLRVVLQKTRRVLVLFRIDRNEPTVEGIQTHSRSPYRYCKFVNKRPAVFN